MPLSSKKSKLITIHKQKIHWTSNSTSAKTAGITHCLYNNLPIILISVYSEMNNVSKRFDLLSTQTTQNCSIELNDL